MSIANRRSNGRISRPYRISVCMATLGGNMLTATWRSVFPIFLFVAICLPNGVLTDSTLAAPLTPWKLLSQTSSFSAWREEHHGWKIVGAVTYDRFDQTAGF